MPTNEQNPSLSYRDAGVDIDAGAELVERIKPHARRTLRPEVMGGLGGFGSLFELPPGRYRHPVLVAGTDGVGTKLKLALATGRHDTIGIDLVGMCVNDIVVQGAEPLFFLDYYATGKLDVEVAASVIKGIADGCAQAGCALVGGETAEMPGMYDVGDYDLAGFAVGVVEKDAILDGSKVAVGDVVLGFASSGPHSNGYSLIRRILELHQTPLDARLPSGRPLMDALMAPTQIYVKPLLGLLADLPVHALAHITGGGITENLPRVLPADTQARIDAQAWTRPEVFEWIERQGNVDAGEMLRTFNCGIGMALVLPADAVDAVSARLRADDIEHWIIGRIEPGSGAPKVVYGA